LSFKDLSRENPLFTSLLLANYHTISSVDLSSKEKKRVANRSQNRSQELS
jgi:hypothetical protein